MIALTLINGTLSIASTCEPLLKDTIAATVVEPKGYIHTNRSIRDFTEEVPKYLLPIEEMMGKRVLDVACGYGGLVKDLRSLGIEAYGVDAKYRDSGPEYLIMADARELPFNDGQFDLIYSAWAMFDGLYMGQETNQNLIQMLREIHRVLKIGGTVRLTSLDKNYLRFRALLIAVRGLKVKHFYIKRSPELRSVLVLEKTK